MEQCSEFTARTVVLGKTFKEVEAAGVAGVEGWGCRNGWGEEWFLLVLGTWAS